MKSWNDLISCLTENNSLYYNDHYNNTEFTVKTVKSDYYIEEKIKIYSSLYSEQRSVKYEKKISTTEELINELDSLSFVDDWSVK